MPPIDVATDVPLTPASEPEKTAIVGLVLPRGQKDDPSQSGIIPPTKIATPQRNTDPKELSVELLTAGQKGWREYRHTGGERRYARDRWWFKTEMGQWKKKARNRKDVPSMTEDDYEQWKKRRCVARATARQRNKKQADTSRNAGPLPGVCQVVVTEPPSA